ncbi:MAG: hypothetical protein MI754_01950 [Chromatiales bacterium]|nr:hypothetical protein [Chromatiales bacterium]
MLKSHWITTCLLTCTATASLAGGSYPPPTGPYVTQGTGIQPSTEWVPNQTQPSPFNTYQPATDYSLGQNPVQQYNPAYPADTPSYAPPAGYNDPYAASPNEQRSYSFNPFGMMNSMTRPMQNIFNDNREEYQYNEPPTAEQWGMQPYYGDPYASPYGGYPQYDSYGGGYYPPAPGYGTGYGNPGYNYSGYGTPYYPQPQGYEYGYQAVPQQMPQAYANPYSDYTQRYPTQQTGQYWQQPQWSNSHIPEPTTSFNPTAQQYQQQSQMQARGLPASPQEWTPQPETGISPGGRSTPVYGAQQSYPAVPATTGIAQPATAPTPTTPDTSMPAAPTLTKELTINGQAPVFRPLTSEGKTDTQESTTATAVE